MSKNELINFTETVVHPEFQLPHMSYFNNDAEFAAGYISALVSSVTPLHKTEIGHWRPMADLDSPLGTIEADAGLLYSTAQRPGQNLLIVEREGSGPGNERNILKWFEAIRAGKPIRLKSGKVKVETQPVRLLLILCFARSGSKGWSDSDFTKTIGFCSLLAEHICRDIATFRPSLEIRIDSRPDPMPDWNVCGKEFANTCRHWL